MQITGFAKTVATMLITGAALSGCSDDDSDIDVVPGVDTGTLLQNWTIEGTTDPTRCTAYGADRMRVIVYNQAGDIHATEFASCGAFRLNMVLRAASYTGTATFLGVNGEPVSQALAIPTFAVRADQLTTLGIDFPATVMSLPLAPANRNWGG